MPRYKPPPKADRETTERIYHILRHNPILFAHEYLKHHIRIQTPGFHLQMMWAALQHRHLAVASPRESSKSTVLQFFYPFHGMLFRKFRFIVMVSNTFKKAAMALDTMKAEMKDNFEIKHAFQRLIITKDAEGDSEFRHPCGWTTKILCRGVDQIGSIRGVKFGAYRPDLIIGDDMEDDELVRNPERRMELQKVFDEALIPAGEKGLCRYVFVGTVLHDDAQLAKLVSKDHYPEYHKLFYKARQDNGTSLWPEKWTLDELKKLEKDKPSVFAKEYQNDPVAGGNVRFKREDFRTWKQEGRDYVLMDREGRYVNKGLLVNCKAAIACDLAWKEKREADQCVILPGLLTPDSDILVMPYIAGRGFRPDYITEVLFSMDQRLRTLTNAPVPIGFEKAMLENVTQWILRQEMRKRNRFLLTKELIWDADKISRIETRLLPRYAQHSIFHQSGMGDLEFQLERFPYGTHDDLIDSLQGLVQLLQFPKHLAGKQPADNEFDRIRKLAIERKYRALRPANTMFGISGNRSALNRRFPVIQSPFK